MTCECECDVELPVDLVSTKEFLPEVEAEAFEVPANIAERYILEAAIEFSRETCCTERTQVIKPQSCVSDYYLTPRKTEQIARVLSICVDGERFDVNRQSERSGFRYFWNDAEWRFAPPFQLRCSPAPKTDCSKCIIVTYASMPDRTACELDRELSTRYHDTIVSGALSRVLKMTRGLKDPYPWTDKVEAERHRRLFQTGKAEAKTNIITGFANGPMSPFSKAEREAGF